MFLSANATMAIYLNASDPHTELDGERAHRNSRPPLFNDPVVRQALGLLMDRKNMQDFVFGRQGVVTANFINQPERLRSPNTHWSFDAVKAARLLDDAG